MKIHVRAPLFDRLTDLSPHHRSAVERPPLRTLNREELRESVRRELEWLLSTRSSLPVDRLAERERLTVLEYGIPDFSACSAGEPEDQKLLVTVITRAVAAFEPRLRAAKVVFERLDTTGRKAEIRIEGSLVIDEVSEPVAFQTHLSVKSGEAQVL
jgi:type VI secretion system lysozyme-like protein